MGKNKYYCKIEDTIYNFQEIQNFILSKQDWKAIEKIVELVGCDYGIAGNIFMQIKENNDEIPTYINQNIQPKTNTNKNTITCPYCKSTNTKKISTTSKAVAIGLFGIFGMGKASKQWHCNSCGSDF